jgi:hypothetical protein
MHSADGYIQQIRRVSGLFDNDKTSNQEGGRKVREFHLYLESRTNGYEGAINNQSGSEPSTGSF